MMNQNDIGLRYLEAAQFFRTMGFFSQHSAMADEALAARIENDVSREWDEPFPPEAESDPQRADMYMLSTDRQRVWQADLECVYAGEKAYVRFLSGLAAISRGAFAPQAIIEQWKGERGPVEVQFDVDGIRYRFFHTAGDMLDPALIWTVNRSIEMSGVVFEVCDNFGMPNFILALTNDEKTRLAARGWKFWPGSRGGAPPSFR
jgi:hypothetical protein